MHHGKCCSAMRKGLVMAVVTMGLAASSWCASSETVLHTFTNGSDGSIPFAGLTFDAKGNLYGTTDSGGSTEFGDGTVFEMTPDANGGFTFQTIHAFSQANRDGGSPSGSVVFDAAGNLYGTTSNGGSGGCGIVYELSPTITGGPWTETILHNFTTANKDGCNPSGFVILDQAGDLFGATTSGGGGANNVFCNHGCGTVFKMSHAPTGRWTEKIIHRFTGLNTDGRNPLGGLVFDTAGNLWGTTQTGGNSHSSTCGGTDLCGTVFELTPNFSGTWTESTSFSFTDDSTGFNPVTNLVIDAAGNLYGTTVNGGTSLGGLVFKLTLLGGGQVLETIVHQFAGGIDGLNPFNGLTIDGAGNLYGAVQNGGGTTTVCVGGFVPIGCGVVYKLTPDSTGTVWTETILYAFLGSTDGASPLDDHVAVDASGNVFGTAAAGGDFNSNLTHCTGKMPGGCGVVFEVQP